MVGRSSRSGLEGEQALFEFAEDRLPESGVFGAKECRAGIINHLWARLW
jgi:hypothetical protein